MMPILYGEHESEFNTNGFGILRDAIECEVIQALNGEYELEMVYPVKGIHFGSIAQRSIILAKPDPATQMQPFRVYRISKPMKGKVSVYARHIAYDMMGIPVSPFTAKGIQLALMTMKSKAVGDCPFEFYSDKSTTSTMELKTPRAMWELLGGTEGSLLDTYGGEYEFDRWRVSLYNHRGTDRGVSIRYGKNLTDLKQEENCAGCYTGVYPFWSGATGGYQELSEKIVTLEGNFGYTRTLTLDLSSEWMEQPSEDQLRERTKKYISDNDIGVPAVSWKVEFVALEQTEEYKGKAILERVFLGDTVSVEFADMGISAKARVNEIRYLPILERYKNVSLGSVRSNFADIIINQGKEIHKRPDMTAMERAIELLTKAITGAKGGAVRLLDTDGDDMPDTLYIADNADPAKALKVWRFNYEGWGASKTGYSGPFTMGASFDSGILAEFITAGTLYGMLLKAGWIMSEDGKIIIDLTDGSEPVFNGGISANGIKVRADQENADVLFKVFASLNPFGPYFAHMLLNSATQMTIFETKELFGEDGATPVGVISNWYSQSNNDSATLTVKEGEAEFKMLTANGDQAKVWVKKNDVGVHLQGSNHRGIYLWMNATGSGMYLTDEDGTKILGGLAHDKTSGKSMLQVDVINGREANWSYNDDGSYTMKAL